MGSLFRARSLYLGKLACGIRLHRPFCFSLGVGQMLLLWRWLIQRTSEILTLLEVFPAHPIGKYKPSLWILVNWTHIQICIANFSIFIRFLIYPSIHNRFETSAYFLSYLEPLLWLCIPITTLSDLSPNAVDGWCWKYSSNSGLLVTSSAGDRGALYLPCWVMRRVHTPTVWFNVRWEGVGSLFWYGLISSSAVGEL